MEERWLEEVSSRDRFSGTRRKVWAARWWEDVIQAGGTLGRLRRSEVIGTVAEFPTRGLAMQALSRRLGSVNSGKARPQSVRTFGSFVKKDDWTLVVLPTLKYATQKHYRYMPDAHLIPTFGQRQLRELTLEELQSFLSRKLKGGLAWGNRSSLQVWSEQDSRCSRGTGHVSGLVVGAWRFELQTSCAQGRRATRLRYAPT